MKRPRGRSRGEETACPPPPKGFRMNDRYIPLASEEEFDRLEAGVARTLERVGLHVPSAVLLGCLEDYGARVDRDTQVARFPGPVIDKTLSLLQCGAAAPVKDEGRGALLEDGDGDSAVSGPDASDGGTMAAPPAPLPPFQVRPATACPFFFDSDLSVRRPATRDDTIAMIRLADRIPESPSVSLSLINRDVDARMESLEGARMLIANSSRPGGTGIRRPEEIPYFIEIDRALGRGPANPQFVQTGRCMISPLKLGEDFTRIYESLIRHGYTERFWMGTMPLAGATAPVTAAGGAVVAAAEILGCFALAKAVNPEATCSGTLISGVMDLRTGKACYTAPEACLQNALVWQLFRRRYRATIGFARGNYTDAKTPGLQAAWEKTLSHFSAAMYGNFGLVIGGLDGERTFSPVQAMIDIDLTRGVHGVCRGVEINDETLALDEIERIGFAERESYLNGEHTLMRYREALWTPELLDRTSWTDAETELRRERDLLAAANEKWKRLVAEWTPPDVDEALLKEIDRILDAARKEFLG